MGNHAIYGKRESCQSPVGHLHGLAEVFVKEWVMLGRKGEAGLDYFEGSTKFSIYLLCAEGLSYSS